MNNQDILDTIEGILIMVGLLGARIGWGQGKRASDSEERQQIIRLLKQIELSVRDSVSKSRDNEGEL